MKIVVRTFAVAMLFAGLVASGHSRQTAARPGHVSASPQVASSLVPAPACPPDDPDACGIGK